ncbi:FAD-dependent oxidoreductase [Verrucomicrobia bacterium LW23]|nr:FAD-dependent oxidoreductase [Verrucomicrobia bacterium LW23]
MFNFLLKDKIPLLVEADVLVVGAGSAGCCAALAAAEGGTRSVVLVERYGFAGGTSTQMLDTFYGFFTPGEAPRKVVGGIPDRVVDRLDSAGEIFLRPNTYGAGTGVNYNPERLKLVWDEMLDEAGVRLLLHATLVDVEAAQDGILRAAILWTKRGFFRIAARRFVDCSGDADLCHLAGIACEKAGDLEPAQTLTTTFRMSNVALDVYEKTGGKKMLAKRMAQAVDSGTHPLPRKSGSLHRMNATACISTVAVRVANVDATDFEQLTAAEKEGRRQAFLYERFFRECVPGFEESNIIGLSHHIGVRETRRVYGEYRLTKQDCLGVARFDDKVLLCGAPIEDHRAAPDGMSEETVWAYVPDGNVYDVPYRTLVPKGRDELWVAGRCFSATHDAHASCRSMAQTMAMGQAAGLAAALSLEEDTGARGISIRSLQERLLSLGAILEMPDAVADTSSAGWKRRTGAVAPGVTGWERVS